MLYSGSVHQIECIQLLVQHLEHLLVGSAVHTHQSLHIEVAHHIYLAVRNAKQIAEILGISENTLKYHNKNMYSKLGVSSRKQMPRFAALKQHRDAQTQTA